MFRKVFGISLCVLAGLVYGQESQTLQYDSVHIPFTDKEKNSILSTNTAWINGVNVSVDFQVIIRSNDTHNGAVYGQTLNKDGVPVSKIGFNEDGTELITLSNTEVTSIYLDFTSFLEGPDNTYYLISHFELPNPAAMYMFKVQHNPDECKFENISDLQAIDWSAFNGLWSPCAGSVSPWNTHLGSEEYEPDARAYVQSNLTTFISYLMATEQGEEPAGNAYAMLRYYDIYPEDVTDLSIITDNINPYRYGYVTEVSVDDNGIPHPTKHFSMGRKSIENCIVLKDLKTVYISDDGTNTMLSMYIMDKAGDMSAGTLYVANITQDTYKGSNGAEVTYFNVEWIDVGHATDDQISAFIESLTFSDIFDAEFPDWNTYGATNGCNEAAGFRSVNSYPAGQECLRLIEGMELAASRLECRRYGGYVGATTEFSKMEGITYDPNHDRLYVSISRQYRGMKDNDSKYDKGGYNRIRVEANSCGCVYQLELNSFNIATNMSATICGIMNPDKTCNVNVMAEPDNIVYNAKYDVLVIAEDSHGHENNYCWLYKPETGELQRMLTGPVGSEITSAGFVEIDSCFYVKAVVSHPYEGIIGPYADPDLNPYYSGSSAYLGVIGIKPEKACSSVSPDDISSSSSSNNDEIHSYKIGIIVLSVLLFLIIVIFALFYWKQTKDKRTNSLLNGSLM